MLSIEQAVIFSLVMGAVIFFCRVFPFIFFRSKESTSKESTKSGDKFIRFVEKTAPPVAMTVLCFNAAAGSVKENLLPESPLVSLLPPLAACAATALLHIWKRNALLSIFAGTALFMLLDKFPIM
jgi:branched-subunit amino acid transport protein AzlD